MYGTLQIQVKVLCGKQVVCDCFVTKSVTQKYQSVCDLKIMNILFKDGPLALVLDSRAILASASQTGVFFVASWSRY